MSAETLRKAAALMRERAEDAGKPENSHPYGDKMFPPATTPQAYGDLMREYLGGPWGEQAASWHPAVALAVADWLDATANDVEHVHTPVYNLTSTTVARALAVARLYLGEQPC